MVKNWVLMLMMVLVALQSLTVIADSLQLHPSDAEHAHHGDIHGGVAHASQLDPLEIDSDTTGHPDHAEHCHTGHCHGSLLLLVTQPYELSLRLPFTDTSTPDADISSAHIAAILRPPIV